MTGAPRNKSEINVPENISPASSIRSGFTSRTTVASRALPPASDSGKTWPRMSLVCMMTTCVSDAPYSATAMETRRSKTRTWLEIITRNCTLPKNYGAAQKELFLECRYRLPLFRRFSLLYGACGGAEFLPMLDNDGVEFLLNFP